MTCALVRNIHCVAAQTLNVGSGSTVAMAPRFAFQAAAVVRANGNTAAIGGVTGRGSLHLA